MHYHNLNLHSTYLSQLGQRVDKNVVIKNNFHVDTQIFYLNTLTLKI